MHDRHWINIALASICIILIGGCILTYFTYVDGTLLRPIIEFHQPFENGVYYIQTNKNEYKRGEMVYGKYSFCKHRNVRPMVQWTLANQRYWPYVEKTVTSNITGCVEDILFPIETVLEDTSLGGNHHFNGTLYYRANPWRIVEFRLQTNSFTIIE